MRNESEINSELLRIKAASAAFTNEALNRILYTCDDLLNSELPDCFKEKLADIDVECCRLICNRLLLDRIGSYLTSTGKSDNCCSFFDVYVNCCRTVESICMKVGTLFSYTGFVPPCNLKISAEKCCMLLLLPIALALDYDPENDIRLDVSRRGDRLELEYVFSGKVPPVAELAEECKKTDLSSGLYFTRPLLALDLTEAAANCGALLSVGRKGLALSLPIAESGTSVNSTPESYIDNRITLPYIKLSGIVRREI